MLDRGAMSQPPAGGGRRTQARGGAVEGRSVTGLRKRMGCRCGTPDGKHISGLTVANLSRDGMFSVITNRQYGSAGLTERGQWFARTLIEAAGEVQARE
jgi:hypothetical protein